MIIGIDFDNTIINYENIFGELAIEKELIPSYLAKDKNSVKDYLINKNCEDQWTILQGEVYGGEILRASFYPGLIDALNFFYKNKHIIYVISHRTKYPYKGKKTDLHAAAQKFLKKNKFFVNDGGFVEKLNTYFETTIEKKIQRIIELNCDIFIDDLKKVLMLLPATIERVHFCPNASKRPGSSPFKELRSWSKLQRLIIQNA